MPLFLHVHDAPELSVAEVREAHLRDASLGRSRGVDYMRYWHDADAGKFFCLVEAPTAEDADAVHLEGHGMAPSEVYSVRGGLRDRQDYEAMRILFAGTLAPDSNCIDVGSNIGVLLREMVRCAPDGSHIAYEPIPGLSASLATRFPDVEVRQAVLSDRPGERQFVYLPERPGYSHLPREGEPETEPSAELITVPAHTLDTALPKGYVPALIKIDVEEAELDVLRGARETLAEFRPIVIVEHGALRLDDSEELFALLSDHAGLRLYDIDGNGPMGRKRFLDVVAEAQVWNFIARP